VPRTPSRKTSAQDVDAGQALIRELERTLRAQPKAVPGMTRAAIGQQLGLSPERTLALLKRLAAEGRLVTGRGPVTDVAGRLTSAPVYRIKAA